MSVDTKPETVQLAAHNLRNQVMPSEAHRTFAADLLHALLTERDEAIRQREAQKDDHDAAVYERNDAIKRMEAAEARVIEIAELNRPNLEQLMALSIQVVELEARAATAEARVQALEATLTRSHRVARSPDQTLCELVAALQDHAREAGWQDVDQPIADLLEWRLDAQQS